MLCLNGHAQSKNLHFDHLSIADGLSHNSVFSIIQDKQGCIWIATQNGLNQYDGYEFKVYQNSNMLSKHGFQGQHILCLLEDSHGNIWAGTEQYGINLKESNYPNFKNLKDDDAFAKIKDTPVSSLFEDANGQIWITTIGAGILVYNLVTKSSIHYNKENSGLHNDQVFNVAQDDLGRIWVATTGIGINLLEQGRFRLLRAESDLKLDGYRKSLMIHQNSLWIGTDNNGLFHLNLDNFEVRKKTLNKDEDKIESIRSLRSIQNSLFIGTDGNGLYVLDYNSGDISHYQNSSLDQHSLNSNAIHAITSDYHDNIWLGTFNGGLNIIKKNKTWFDIHNKKNSDLKHNSILGLSQIQNDDILICTDGGGLSVLTPSTNKIQAYQINDTNPISGDVIKCSYQDNDGILYIGMYRNGLNIINPISGESEHFIYELNNPNSIASNNVWDIIERKDGQIWMATLGGGINIYDKSSKRFKHLKHDPRDSLSLADDAVMILFEDNNQDLWVGTSENGLDKWNMQKNGFDHYTYDENNPNSISNNEIRCIFQDSKNQLWIGTEGGGLNIWNGKDGFKIIKKDDGLIANTVMGITEDQNGLIWISTFNGLSIFDPSNQSFKNFDFHVKGRNNQFNQNAILAAKDGQIFIGGINGLNAIHPNDIKDPFNKKFNIGFTKLEVSGKEILYNIDQKNKQYFLKNPIEKATDVYLKHADKSLTLSFSAFDYANQNEIKYQYLLEGFDENWNELPKGINQISYTNLDPKKYKLFLRYGDEEIFINIHVSPPFWDSLWFKLLLVISFFIMLWALNKYLVEKNKAHLQKKILHKERQILRLKNKNLEHEVLMTNTKLLSSTAQMAHKNEVLVDIKESLQKSKEDDYNNLYKVVRKIDRELENQDYWTAFNTYFDKVDQNFTKSILTAHPQVTKNDLRLCALIRLNLSSKEIASMLNITIRGVEKSKYRLKKRIQLDKDESLTSYIRSFNPTV